MNCIVRRPANFRRALTLQCCIGLFFRFPTSTDALASSFSSSSVSSSSSSSEQRARRAAFPVFFDSSNDLHRDLQYHPEQPARISACVKAIEEEIRRRQQQSKDQRTIDLVDVAPSSIAGASDTDTDTGLGTAPGPVRRREPFTDSELEHAKSMLYHAHDDVLVAQLEHRCRTAKQKRKDDGKPPLGHIGYIDFDTYVTTETFDVCVRAAAAWIRAVDFALSGSADGGNSVTSSAAMALTRPPGHHATSGSSNGFCLYNFAATAALHVLQQDPNMKVSVLDWDVHFGQGTADIVLKHPNIRYVSIHQVPAFPYEGETYSVKGTHQNVMTIPVPAETTWANYKDKLEKALAFVCTTAGSPGEWEPDVVIVSAGYDSLDSDELANVSLQAADFGKMTTRLIDHLATSSSKKKKPAIILGLEGGYQLNPNADGGSLQVAILETIRPLLDL